MSPDKFDAESVVKLNAELVVVSSTAADSVGKTLEGLALSSAYVSNAGLKITDNLNELIKTMAEFLEIEVDLK